MPSATWTYLTSILPTPTLITLNKMFTCGECGNRYYSKFECEDHMNAYNHWFDCETCDRVFMDQNSCNQHMQSADHFSDRYCRECKKYFQNAHNLRQHLNSRTHRGSDVKCPFCNTGFVTHSGASHHLETGSCPGAPRLNRESIARVVQRLDTAGVIAKKQIEWHEQNVE
ncbi:unnamed protein product [Penicillium salamii]|uniref:C2H2-type domain-containing protein n=1 Tax=Penicillium salamii TaxID=1612424 RepID=A0A9W4N3B9_9EURO|nr:unnamed protein product [Penicillium salamii]CAG8239127.1 unnamed protein product [Penicillium salamii]CAG8241446.1 unnamed protein product [Penicillium salamii]CAG8262536.1 unnamed protein product [Penicillium salamii]CAG8390458.1 unnamed protein product [Penicillium salamii]